MVDPGPWCRSNGNLARFKKVAVRVCSPDHLLTTGRGPVQIAALLFDAPRTGERITAPCLSSTRGFNPSFHSSFSFIAALDRVHFLPTFAKRVSGFFTLAVSAW